tara:strand:+ start:526 stop:1257 length:732 start_codon:yes stop_codon:yes gene_type:complete
MQIDAIHTPRFSEQSRLEDIIAAIGMLETGDVICITTKIISLIEGQRVPVKDTDKDALIRRQADAYLSPSAPYNITLTMTKGALIPSAGIDASNAQDCYILYPTDPMTSAQNLWDALHAHYGIDDFGVILTDSHSTILRRGVTGFALAWAGFKPFYSYQGRPDIFGRPLGHTMVNIPDSLAGPAVFAMGEGDEQTPIARIRGAHHVQYIQTPVAEEDRKLFFVKPEEDIYAPILNAVKWQRED